MTTAQSEATEEVANLHAVVRALTERTGQLERALESRIAIEQAKGVLAERLQVTVDDAFGVLRAAARSDRRELRGLAREVVASPVTPPCVEREHQRLAARRRVPAPGRAW